MTTLEEKFPGVGLWSTTGEGPPSPPRDVSPRIIDQPLAAPPLDPPPITPRTRAKTKTHSPWTCRCKCCKCCGYDFCARCCCPCTCCRCYYWCSLTIVLIVLAIGLVVLVLWKVLHPKLPTYNVDNVHFSYSTGTTGSPPSYVLNTDTIFDMELTNPNTKIGIYYDQIKLNLKLFGMVIGNQIIPPFYDGYKVTKYIHGNMVSGPLTLSTANQVALVSAGSAGNMPLNLKIDVKVRIKIGHLTTPQLKVELNCVVTIDPGITSGSQIRGTKCKFKFVL